MCVEERLWVAIPTLHATFLAEMGGTRDEQWDSNDYSGDPLAANFSLRKWSEWHSSEREREAGGEDSLARLLGKL